MTEPISDIVDLQPGERVGVEPQRARALAGDEALIVCDNLVKIYKVADLEVVALQGLDLLVERGEFIALVGASGSGKSTLHEHPRRARRPVGRARRGGRARPRRDGPPGAHRLPAPGDRLRLAADGHATCCRT